MKGATMTTALILVDLQNDFMPGGSLAVTEGDATVAVANDVMPNYQIVVVTQDWHPDNHGSFVDNHHGAELFQVVDLDGLDQVLWPRHWVQGTVGAAFHPELDQGNITKVFPKGTDAAVDSHSGLYDNGKRHSTGLAEWLKVQGVVAVDVMGLATDYCVKFTAIDAANDGFATRLILDGCRGVDINPGDVDRAVDEMRSVGVEVV